MYTNGHHNPALILVDTPPETHQQLVTDLQPLQVRCLSSADEVLALMTPAPGSTTPDAVLTHASTTGTQLFQRIRSEVPEHHRPLLILVTDTPTDAQADLADILITPPMLRQQLEPLLSLRRQMLASQHQLEQQQETIAALHQELATARRIHDELEVLKNAIVRNVSHELKTPLLQIKASVGLLREEPDEEKQHHLIEMATNSTSRLEGIVRNITMLSGSLETSLGPIIVADVIEAALRNLRRSWEQRDHLHRVQIQVVSGIPPVLGDKQGISTVIQLLIDNALKFSETAVTVECELIADAGQVEIRVKDQGIGIAPQERDRIFEIFYQVDSSSTRKYGGTGVGLAIVRLILENHGCQIQVESEVGRGSIFSFRLPVITL